jgi:hypothetical protein
MIFVSSQTNMMFSGWCLWFLTPLSTIKGFFPFSGRKKHE